MSRDTLPRVLPTLAEVADQMEARARELKADGKHEAAAELALAAADVRRAIGGIQRLPKSPVTDKLRGDMEAAHRQKLSDARTGGKTHPMMLAARKAGLVSIADLAEALGYTRSGMSRILAGDRGISDEAAKKFEELTGKPWRQ